MHRFLSLFAILTIALSLAAENPHCQHVGGAVATNFLDPTTTSGTATGDLKGSIGVDILSVSGGANGTTVFHNQHHWVTESGDTLFLKNADATAFPASGPLVAISYTDGVEVTGGTGRFAKTTGKLAVWGAADLQRQQIVLRYEGEICSQ